MDSVTSHQLTTYPFNSLPEDAQLHIMGKLRPFQLKLLTGTCTNLNNMREKGWKLLCSRDFRWLCTPSLDISANKTWQGTYRTLAALKPQNIAWQHSSFDLNITGEKLGVGLDAQGYLVTVSNQGWIQSWSMDGTPVTSISIPSEIWSQIENPDKFSVSLLPKNDAFLFTPTFESQNKGYLYMDSSLHLIANMTPRDSLIEIDHNVFALNKLGEPTFQLDAFREVHRINIDQSNTMKTKIFGESIEAFSLYDGRYMTVGHFGDHPVHVYSPHARPSLGRFAGNITQVLPDGLVVSRLFRMGISGLNDPDRWYYCFLTLEISKENIDFKVVKQVIKNHYGKIEQLPHGDVVFICKMEPPIIEIWSMNPDYEKHMLVIKLSAKDQVFVHPITGQILVLSPPQGNNPHYTLHVYSPSLDLKNEKSG